MDLQEKPQEWIEANRPEIDKCVEHLYAYLDADPSMRLPRSEEDRKNGFEQWLNSYRQKIAPVMESEIRQTFPHLAAKSRSKEVEVLIEREIWPKVEADLRSYALRGVASAWISRHMGDATTIGQPEWEGSCWRVPIGVNKYGDNLGQIVIDRDGNMIPDLTTTREQMFLPGNELPV